MTAYVETDTAATGDARNLVFVREGSEADVTLSEATDNGDDSGILAATDEEGVLSMYDVMKAIENAIDEREGWRAGLIEVIKHLR